MATYYQILGVTTKATAEEITAAYRRLAKVYHPDMPDGNGEYFRELTDAYNQLKDTDSRFLYDQSLRSSNTKPTVENTEPRQNTNSYNYDNNLSPSDSFVSSKIIIITGVALYIFGLISWTISVIPETKLNKSLHDQTIIFGYVFLISGYLLVRKGLNPKVEARVWFGSFSQFMTGLIGGPVLWFFILIIIYKTTGYFSFVEELLHKKY